MWLFLPNGVTILLPKGSHQKWSSAYPSAQRWLSACPLGEVSDVLLSCQAGAPKGHLPQGGSDSIHIHHPYGLILHNAAGAHCGHSRFNCHFQLQGFWGCLVSSHWQWVSLRTGHHFLEAQRWCHFLCSFQRPSWWHGLGLCTFTQQMLLHPSTLSLPSPRTLAVRPPFWLLGNWRGLSSSCNQHGGM